VPALIDLPARQVLVERAMAGDHDAFTRLVDDGLDRLHAIARLILHDPDDAQDAVQDALVHAWRELPRLRDSERFEAWTRRLLVNACHDLARRQRRHALVHLAASVAEPAGPDGWRAVDERDRLRRGFARLPVEQRVVLVLVHYLGLSGPEIAAMLELPIGTVRSRLRYATRAMQAALEADDRVGSPLGEGAR
jgi:RNA polymerase sigma-70 factor (ECF subfamily)